VRARMLLTSALMRKPRRRVDRRPHPHHDCDKPDKRCRRNLRETPVYSIKIKRFQLSSPETRRCFTPTMARTIAMLRPLCFAKWDKVFYFSGHRRSCLGLVTYAMLTVVNMFDISIVDLLKGEIRQ
jgi:hypothetical protein